MQGSNLLLVTAILQVFIVFFIAYSAIKLKSLELDFTKNTLYKELHYIKAFLIAMSIVLLFFGWNISVNVRNDISQDLKTKIEQDFNTALNGFIVEVPLDTCKTEITYKFKDLKDIKGNPVNNKKPFRVQPIVSLNYVGQPYTVIHVTNKGFTVSKMEISEDFTWGGLKSKKFGEENQLIIWIINRD